MALQWKSHEIYKTSGPVIRVGTFQGNNRDNEGNLVKSTITQKDVDQMYDRVGVIPIYCDLHDYKQVGRRPVGFAFKFAKDGEVVSHNGFVFDKDAQVRMVRDGVDQLSPEIETSVDEFGNVTERNLSALCLVPSSAMGNEVEFMITEVFNTPTEAGTQPPTQQPPFDAEAFANAIFDRLSVRVDEVLTQRLGQTTQETETPSTPPSTGQTDSTDQQVIRENERLKRENELLLTDRYNGLVAELKALGTDPTGIVDGYSMADKIKLLTRMKAKTARSAPLDANVVPTTRQPSDQQEEPPKKTEAEMAEEVLAELGLANDKYRQMLNE